MKSNLLFGLLVPKFKNGHGRNTRTPSRTRVSCSVSTRTRRLLVGKNSVSISKTVLVSFVIYSLIQLAKSASRRRVKRRSSKPQPVMPSSKPSSLLEGLYILVYGFDLCFMSLCQDAYKNSVILLTGLLRYVSKRHTTVQTSDNSYKREIVKALWY